ncbi:MAG TPA: hypothetical protein VJ464_11495 [Blastocatellia bacterium]|nr:hypothetical protein [Blastocatellia bacterium]
MLKDRVMELFKNYEKDVQQVIAEVLTFEQEHISLERFRVKEPIKEIIDQAVKK